ncbi:Arf GTPase activating protein [Cordyceps fumosorosea ARSEF 2679]|uniref:Arf GTPase activating protein n=1 Tax=Cordyceps fumosorosea (strain ARSEF 2679) TaxID=1081104 RepID=A0A162MP60_CORFA|nr:Arf GTPase activating protein [Cordyceps fumosorosea ARSEF 2679]OAA64800.1 Arf GTPase activating protein [Cordyceps fumosorosea ARSEF 2679]
MSGVISKRQQARNEKQLQELVQTVTGNNICADCYARNPAWASWSLGVFLCMRCAAIHRKLGTHISKVKSLSMDSWSNEQVDNMRKVGNLASNRIYNASNKKPPVTIDVDEADSAMERFIRQKYTHDTTAQSNKPRSPISDEGTPPPLPPKNSKFGFRAAFSRSKTLPNRSPTEYAPGSPPLTNKPSKVFGATVDYDAPDETDKKLIKLREMGFQNNQRNSIVLKGVSGDVERAVEALVRLGEGDQPPPAPPKEKTLRATRSLTPMMPNSSGLTGGLTVVKRAETDRPTTSSTVSTNPFDMLNRAQPQTAHSTGSMHNTNPYGTSTNPYGVASAQASPIDLAFQNLTLSQHQTGAAPNGAGLSLPAPPPLQMYGHSAPSSPQLQNGSGLSPHTGYPFHQNQQSSLQPQPTGFNPYFSQPAHGMQQQQQQQQSFYAAQSGMAVNTSQMSGQMASNPFLRSPTRVASPPPLGQISETATFSTSPLPLASPGTNPFFSAQPSLPSPGAQQQQQYMQPQQQYLQQQQHVFQRQPQQQHVFQTQPQQQTQQFAQQPFQQQPFQQQLFQQQQMFQPQQAYQQYHPPRHDKASIMALYGQTPKPQPQPQLQAQAQSIPENQAVEAFAGPSIPTALQQPRSVSQPLPGTNPFASSIQQAPSVTAGVSVDAYKTGRQISRESMNLGLDMAWTNNGRHSPDAFASLSARHDVAPQVNVLASCYIVGTTAQLKGLHYCTPGVTGKRGRSGIPEVPTSGLPSPPTSPPLAAITSSNELALLPKQSKRRDIPGGRRRDRRGGAALAIREECERFFCEPMKTAFHGERNLSMHGSGLTGAYLQTPPAENQLRASADRSGDNDGGVPSAGNFEVDAWMEVWDYIGGASFRAFLATRGEGGDAERSLFVFFDLQGVAGRDLKKALMALIELAEGPLGCRTIVTCMDRRMPVDEALELTKSLQWVGFEMTTLDHWANDVDVTSRQWLFMGMEL